MISSGSATIAMAALAQVYNGDSRPVTATSIPAGLTVQIAYAGIMTAPTEAGSYAVTATISDSNYSGTSTGTLVVSPAAATVVLGGLNQTYDGMVKNASESTTPGGLAVALTYSGAPYAPTNAGSYAVVGTVTDPNYVGATTHTLTIANAAASVNLANLSQTYDGTPKSVSNTTTPAGLLVSVTYNGCANSPTNSGSYSVIGTIINANYAGGGTNTLVIGNGAATVLLTGLAQVFDGTPRPACASTTPAGLSVDLTYNGASAPPTNVDSYAVVGTIADSNYAGSSTNTLIVSEGTAAIIFSDLIQTYDGTGKWVTLTSAPGCLSIGCTYDGSSVYPINAGSYSVVAKITSSNWQGQATTSMVIAQATATIIMSGLGQTWNGTPRAVQATTAPAGLGVGITYDGRPLAPTSSGIFTVVGTITSPNYTGNVTNTLTVRPASPTLTLQNLSQVYDGASKNVTVVTMPAGLPVSVIYNGTATAPVNAGSYTVVATVTDTNYLSSVQGTLVIAKATAVVTLGDLTQAYNGSPKPVSSTTVPTGLPVSLTYNGVSTAPTNVGSYTIVATIVDPNYDGQTTNILSMYEPAGAMVLSWPMTTNTPVIYHSTDLQAWSVYAANVGPTNALVIPKESGAHFFKALLPDGTNGLPLTITPLFNMT
jgi:hypothetical protein